MKDFSTTSLSAIHHVLIHKPHRIKKLLIHAPSKEGTSRLSEIEKLARTHTIATEKCQGPYGSAATAILAPFEYVELNTIIEQTKTQKRSLVVVLDHLQDTQNFGAICRSADAFGATAVIIPKDRSVQVTAGVYDASVGAVETVPIVMVTNIGEALRKLKVAEHWVVGTAMAGESKPMSELPDFEKIALVMGSELSGLSTLVEKLCDALIHIPMKGKVESLNVSVASGIFLQHLGQRLNVSSP